MSYKTYTVTIGTVTNAGEVCQNPVVTLVGHGDGTVVNCIDSENGIYQVQTTEALEGSSLTFLVQCTECDVCPPVTIVKTFCDDNMDCGDCEICGTDGFCQSICAPDQFCENDKCVNCLTDDQCANNQVCLNGNCTCPDGSDPGPDGRCSDCSSDSDCDICEICQDGTCTPKDCHNGVCNPETGECQDCLNSGDCEVNEVCVDGDCQCADGFTRIDGVCVSVECQLDSDCPTCFQCSNNTCIPVTCPTGKVPVTINGQCQCVDECDPNNPGCEDGNYCAPSTIDGLYGCVPCTGDCASTCDYPCVCSQSKDICVDNPCSDVPCVDGSDCGDGCGCLNGTCVFCDSIACPSSECSNILGCGCTGNKCTDSDTGDNCNFAPCEISSDCRLGCTCQSGQCVSCDNYSCAGNTCVEKDGCKCVGNSCVGDDIKSSCDDSLTIIKDDGSCSLVGTLTKTQCCSCPEVTVAMVPKASMGVSGDTVVLSFEAQLRKGEANSTNPTGNPLMSDTTNPNIADNDTAITGAIEMGYRNRYNVYTVSYGPSGQQVRTFIGSTLGTRSSVRSTYSNSATTTLSSQVGKVGSEVTENSSVKVVTEIIVDFVLTSSLDFSNNCSYPAGTSLGSYTITSDGQVTSLNPTAKGVTSADCRNPLFKWYKSDTTSFGSTPFRKKYIAGLGGTYVDVLRSYDLDGLEPCKTYLLESDCTCDDPKSEFIVFCNPTAVPYTLSDCNTKITFGNEFVPCEVNASAGATYGVRAGSLDLSFTANTFPAGQQYISATSISEVSFFQTCGSAEYCNNSTTANVPSSGSSYYTECRGDGTFDVTFVPLTTCNITKVVLSTGAQLVTNFTTTLDIGSYTAMVYTDCNCPPVELSFSENCCDDIVVPNCFRDCDGNLVGCGESTNVTYSDTSGNELPSLADYVAAANPTEAITVLVSRTGCESKQLNIPSDAQNCCADYRFEWVSSSDGTGGVLTVFGSSNPTATVTVQAAGTGSPIVSPQGGGVFNISGLVDGKSYDLSVFDVTCGTITDTITTGNCSAFMLDPIDSDVCNFAAVVPSTSCQCADAAFSAQVTDVVVMATQFEVTWTASVLGTSEVTAATFIDNFGSNGTDIPSTTQTVVIPRSDGLGGFKESETLVISSSGISLEDNCKYAGQSLSFSISSNGSAVPGSVSTKVMVPSNPTERYTYFVWNRSGLEFKEYQDSRSEITDNTSVGGIQYVKQGQTYSVVASCGACSDSDTATYCCPPVITSDVSSCNKQVVINVLGAPGSYDIVYGESGGQVTITDRTTPVSLAFSSLTSFTDTAVTVSASLDNTCTFGHTVTLQTECEPTLTPSACVGDKYDLTLSGCNGATYTITPSGGTYDAVNGNTVEGIVKNSGITLNVVDNLTSCEFDYVENVAWADPCIVACDDKAWLSSPVTYVEGTCVTTTYQDDGEFQQGVIDTSGTVDKVGVSTALAEGAVVGDYDGPNYAAAGVYTNTLANTIVGSLVNGPNDYVVRFYQGSDDCFTSFVVNVPETDCACQLDYTLTGNQATCSNVVELDDGTIVLSGYTNVTHFGISSEGALTYDGPTTVATATAVSTDPEDLVIGIPNSSGGQTSYIIRLFGTTDVCFEDTEVIVLDQSCECDGPDATSTGTYTAGTCDSMSGLPNDDGAVIWKLVPGTAAPNADRYLIVQGTSITGGLTYATATALPSATGVQGTGFEYILKSDVPTAGETYTFRIYDGDDSCFVDKTVTVPGTICAFDCSTLCDGLLEGTQCNGTGTECQSGNCVATAACIAGDCTSSSFDSQGCATCANSDSGTPCQDGECDGSGNCVEFIGGCCNGASCTETTESACTGTWLGVNSNCTANEVVISGVSIDITPDFGADCWYKSSLTANINCSGCSCSDVSGTYEVILERSGNSDLTLSSGNISGLVDTSEDCSSTALQLDTRSADVFGAAFAGDVIRVNYVFSNPSGCTYIGTGSYSDTYTITQSDLTNFSACQPAPEGTCCQGSICLGATTEAGCSGSWIENGPNCFSELFYCCDPASGTCSGPNSYTSPCGTPSCAGGWTVVDSCSNCDPVGACCTPSGSCSISSQSNCGGTFLGAGTNCSPNQCPGAVGACCLGSGSCQQGLEQDCIDSNGIFQGVGSACIVNGVNRCLGACCFLVNPNRVDCYPLGEANCTSGGGFFQGVGSTCANGQCTQYL